MTDDLRPPYRIAFDNARDPYTARNALGAVDAKYVTDAITAIGGGGNVSNSGAPTAGQYARWVTATTIQGVAPATVLSDIGAQPAGSYQPLDADLTSLAAAAGTNTIYYRSAANTWSAVTIGGNLTFVGGTLDATAGVAPPAPQHGRLTYVSATALKFAPYSGDKIKINGVLYDIPAAGIAGLANTGIFIDSTPGSNLAATTLYFVYAFNNAGTITGMFSITGHATSATAGNVGVETAFGNDIYTLIGMVRTNASSQFQSNAGNQLVISWFNRRPLSMLGVSTAGASTASTTPVEVAFAARIFFIHWGEDAVSVGLGGTAGNTGANQNCQINFGLDGTTAQAPQAIVATSVGANQLQPVGAAIMLTPSEGYHFYAPLGWVGGGTGVFYLWLSAIVMG